MGFKEVIKQEVSIICDKAEDSLLSTAKRIFQTYYGDNSFIGVIGIGFREKCYYIKGSVDTTTFEREGLENPGAKARHITKSSLQIILGPMPPDKGKPHRMILIPLPSFIFKVSIFEQKKFFNNWKSLVTSYDLPYCEFTVLR